MNANWGVLDLLSQCLSDAVADVVGGGSITCFIRMKVSRANRNTILTVG
jgi:hypothetical protein